MPKDLDRPRAKDNDEAFLLTFIHPSVGHIMRPAKALRMSAVSALDVEIKRLRRKLALARKWFGLVFALRVDKLVQKSRFRLGHNEPPLCRASNR